MTAVVLRGDARRLPLPDGCVDLIVTSPPFWQLRSYTDNGQHYDGQIGSEATPGEWLAALVECTREWVRVLKPSGSIFVNLGDKYSTGNSGESGMAKLGEKWAGGGHSDAKAKRRSAAVEGLPPKTLLGLPWRYALACMDDLGLILRRDIIWSKPNGLPESVQDRCRSSHEYVFHLVKQPRYYAAVDEIREPQAEAWRSTGRAENWGTRRVDSGANQGFGLDGVKPREYNPLGKLPGSVWEIPSQPLTVPASLGVDHFAAYPMELPRRVILGWSPPGVCTSCGEGRRPVTSAPAYVRLSRPHNQNNSPTCKTERNGDNNRSDASLPHGTSATKLTTITGYACACPEPDAPTLPAVVVDPFGGAGTTALVASAYGRLGFSFDRSADYCRLAAWRTTDPAERARALQVPKPPPVPQGQASLFDEVS